MPIIQRSLSQYKRDIYSAMMLFYMMALFGMNGMLGICMIIWSIYIEVTLEKVIQDEARREVRISFH